MEVKFLRQGLAEVKRNIVKIMGDGQFIGTGFFRNKETCITCHHVLCESDKIEVEYEGIPYDTEWLDEISVLEYDLSFLQVKNIDINPLILAQEITPQLPVIIYGFTANTQENLPEGVDIQGIINNIETTYFQRERIINKNNPWNRKPEIKVPVYRVTTSYAGSGLSGSPVWEPNRENIVGMFIGIQGDNPSKDLSRIGYVIPSQLLILKENINRTSKEIRIEDLLDEANRDFSLGNYLTAIDKYRNLVSHDNYLNALSNLGEAYKKVNNYEKSTECFDILDKIITTIGKLNLNDNIRDDIISG